MINISGKNIEINDLLVGDDVLITSYISKGVYMRKGKVEKITPTTVFISSGKGSVAIRKRNIVLVRKFDKK